MVEQDSFNQPQIVGLRLFAVVVSWFENFMSWRADNKADIEYIVQSIALVCWNIWKAKNELIFQSKAYFT